MIFRTGTDAFGYLSPLRPRWWECQLRDGDGWNAKNRRNRNAMHRDLIPTRHLFQRTGEHLREVARLTGRRSSRRPVRAVIRRLLAEHPPQIVVGEPALRVQPVS